MGAPQPTVSKPRVLRLVALVADDSDQGDGTPYELVIEDPTSATLIIAYEEAGIGAPSGPVTLIVTRADGEFTTA